MNQRMLEALWQRVSRGKHTVVLGGLGNYQAPEQLLTLRAHCDYPAQPLAPLLDIGEMALQLLDEPQSLRGIAQRGHSDRFRRMFGELDEPHSLAVVVEVLNRLVVASSRKVVLILDTVEAADDTTIAAMKVLLTRKGWLNASIVLAFQSEQPQGRAQSLLQILLEREGSEAVLRSIQSQESTQRNEPELPSLSTDVMLVLRAAALVGTTFDVEAIGMLINQPATWVLEKLQMAYDAEIPIEDDGSGRFKLRADYIERLRKGLLPSLAKSWHLRLASLLENQRNNLTQPTQLPTQLPTQSEPTATIANDPAVRRTPPKERKHSPPPQETAKPRSTNQAAPKVSLTELLLQPDQHSVAQIAREKEPSKPKETPADTKKAPESINQSEAFKEQFSSSQHAVEEEEEEEVSSPSSDSPQAIAEHLLAAGDFDGGAVHFHQAALKATTMGFFDAAANYCSRALDALDKLPISHKRRLLRIQIMIELGRMQWQAVGDSPVFSLTGAMETLRATRQLVNDSDPSELRAALATMIAGVANDLGDLNSLETALQELTETTRTLVESGNAMSAARLLNDQAAVYLRLGDPVRAAHLLEESRKLFEKRADYDCVALLELAETSHLLARLVLHVKARPGRESEAIEVAKENAQHAKEAYIKAGATRERLRVDETLARLDFRAGNAKQAVRALEQVRDEQSVNADIIGLARTTGALSEVLLTLRQEQQAWEMLRGSVMFNINKGSPIGLIYNRKALELMRSKIPNGLVQELEQQIESALNSLGVKSVPGVN